MVRRRRWRKGPFRERKRGTVETFGRSRGMRRATGAVMKQWLATALATMVALAWTPRAMAGSCPVFGPHDYVRGTGSPVTETADFTVANPIGSYLLQVYNGGLQDA